jgi:hypothetical protein
MRVMGGIAYVFPVHGCACVAPLTHQPGATLSALYPACPPSRGHLASPVSRRRAEVFNDQNLEAHENCQPLPVTAAKAVPWILDLPSE